MSDAVIESLERVLVERDASIRKLQEQIEALEGRLDRSSHDWQRHRIVADVPELPLPRLEMVWVDESDPECRPWSSYRVEYRLVRSHLVEKVGVVPLGSTHIHGSMHEIPWKLDNGRPDLPFRDGAHACYDAAHLNLPLYVIAPGDTPILVSPLDYGPHQYRKGESTRRT